MAVRLYWEVARRSFRRHATYRGATAAGLFTNTVFGFLLAYVLLAVYAERPQVEDFTAVDAVTFVFVSQGLLMVVGIFGDTELAHRISTGDIVVDFHRPLDVQAWWAAATLGRAAFYSLFRGIPPFLVGGLVFHLRLPESLASWMAFLVSVALAVTVSFGWSYLLQLTAFWLMDVRGPHQLGWLTAGFFAGVWVPLVFLPGWLEGIARTLPFAAMVQLPVEVFLGKHGGLELLGVYGFQFLWAAGLALAGRAMFAPAVHRVVVQGG